MAYDNTAVQEIGRIWMKINLKNTKKLFSVRLDDDSIRDIKLLSVDTDKPITALLAEAISDLVRKYGRTEVLYRTVIPEGKSKN
jgi:hypothetical protein